MRGLYSALLVLDNIPANMCMISCAEIRTFAPRQPAVCTVRKKNYYSTNTCETNNPVKTAT